MTPALPPPADGWFGALRKVLSTELPKLWADARVYEQVARLPYGTTVRVSGDTTQVQRIEVTDTAAFAVANPPRPREGAEIKLAFHNTAGGTMGTVTFGNEYALDGAFVKPGVDEHALYAFVWIPG